MPLAGRAKEKGCRVDGSARNNDYVRRKTIYLALMFDHDARNFAPRIAGLKLASKCVPNQRDVPATEGRLDAHHLGIGFGMHKAGESVTRIAADALTCVRIALVQTHAQRGVERLEPQRGEVITQLLDAWLMADRRKRVWP